MESPQISSKKKSQDFFRRIFSRSNDFSKKVNFKTHLLEILLLALLAVGFFLRVYKLGEQSYWIDEGFTYMQMEAIHEHGYPLLNSGIVDVKDIILPYFLQLPRFFGTSPFWLRLIPALFGTASIGVIFLLAKNLWNSKVGLFSAFLFTFSYWQIAWSRQLRPYALLVFFILMALLFLIIYEKKLEKKYLIAVLIFVVCAIASKSAGILLLVPLIGYLFLKKLYRLGLISIALLGLGIYIFRDMLISALGMGMVNYGKYYLNGYFWQFFGIFFFLTILGFLLAIIYEKNNWRVHVVIGIFFIAATLFFSFFVLVNQYRYLFFVTPFLFMYSSYALNFLFPTTKKYLFICIVLLTFDFFTVHSLLFTPQVIFALEEYTPQPNFKQAYQEIKTEIKDEDAIISAYPYMDKIYLGRSTFAIPISYTGRVQDSTGQLGKEHYSGTPMLYTQHSPLDKYIASPLRKQQNAYILVDSMSKSRMSQAMREYIQKFGKVVFQDNADLAQAIWVYRISLKN